MNIKLVNEPTTSKTSLVLNDTVANTLDGICRDARRLAFPHQVGGYVAGEIVNHPIRTKDLTDHVRKLVDEITDATWIHYMSLVFQTREHVVSHVIGRLQVETALMQSPTDECIWRICLHLSFDQSTNEVAWQVGQPHLTVQAIESDYRDLINHLREYPGSWSEKYESREEIEKAFSDKDFNRPE